MPLYAVAALGHTGGCPHGESDRTHLRRHTRAHGSFIRGLHDLLEVGYLSVLRPLGPVISPRSLERTGRRSHMPMVFGCTCIRSYERMTSLSSQCRVAIRDFTTCPGSAIGSATTPTRSFRALGRTGSRHHIDRLFGRKYIGRREPMAASSDQCRMAIRDSAHCRNPGPGPEGQGWTVRSRRPARLRRVGALKGATV